MGTAASFSGLPGGVARSNAPFSFGASFTVEAWVNPATAFQNTAAGIVAAGRQGAENFALDVTAGHAFEFRTSGAAASASAPIAAGQWAHVAGVYDSTQNRATLYVNGAAAASAAGASAGAGSVLAIGNRMDAGSGYTLPFYGSIDSVRVFNAALTAAQVLADYRGGFVSSVTVPTAAGNVLVGLPPDAFGAQAQIYVSIDPVNHPIRIAPATLAAGLAAAPAGLLLVPGSVTEVVPVVNGAPFAGPLGSSATLTIPYSDPGGTGLIGTSPPLTAAGARMYTLNTTVGGWNLLPTYVDLNAHAVVGVTPHFSVFALFAPATIGADASGVTAYPVPWMPGRGGRFDAAGLTFSHLPVSGNIRILTLSGRRVRDIPFSSASAGAALWDGLNDDGRRAASGVYFARVTADGGGAAVIKFAIER
jgi:hypothetical protein